MIENFDRSIVVEGLFLINDCRSSEFRRIPAWTRSRDSRRSSAVPGRIVVVCDPARRACRCAALSGRAAGAELAQPAGHHGGAVRGRRADGHGRSHPGAAPERAVGASGDHRERRRGRRHHRLHPRREGSARRLSVRARQCRHPRGQPDPVQEPALQLRDRFRAGRADRRPVAGAGRAQGFAGRHSAGVHRPCEGQPGQDAVRLGGRGLGDASRLRAAQCGDRNQCRRTFPIAAARRRCRI